MPPQRTRWDAFLRPWGLIWFSVCLHWEVLRESVRKNGPSGLFQVQKVRDEASARLLQVTSSGFVAYENTTIVPSLVKAAEGVILELGPGPGNQIQRFDSSAVKYIYGIDPNPHYEAELYAKVAKHGLEDRYKLVVAGVEDSDLLRKEGITEGSLDTVLCIQVLCAVDDPKAVMKEVWKLLKPGGKFIFWEHGWSRDRLTTYAQAFWNPAWSTFVGCHMTRNVLSDILNSGRWENPNDVEEPVDPLNLLPRIQGVLIKKA